MVKIVWTLPFLFTLLPSCNFNENKVDMQEGFEYTEAELHYEPVNNRIVAPYCLSCHAAATGNEGGINLETRESLASIIPALNRAVLINKSMPKSGSPQLPDGALNMFGAWLRAGAPE